MMLIALLLVMSYFFGGERCFWTIIEEMLFDFVNFMLVKLCDWCNKNHVFLVLSVDDRNRFKCSIFCFNCLFSYS